MFQLFSFVAGFVLLMGMFADLNGKWAGIIVTPDGQEINATYDFKVSGDSLTGTAESPAGVLPIEDGKIKGDDFSFTVTVEGTGYPHTGKVYTDSCGLDIDFGGTKVHTVLKKAAE